MDERRTAAATAPARLRVEPVTTLPERLAVGGGTALLVDGFCPDAGPEIAALEVVVDGVVHPAAGWGMPLPEHVAGNGYWWAIVSFEPIVSPRDVWLEVRATLGDGTVASGRLASMELLPELPEPDAGSVAEREGEAPLVAICMATHEPPIELFRRQVDSIREQTVGDWRCVISDDASSEGALAAMREVLGDDARFTLSPAPERLGFYRNFERALQLAPSGSRWVALCDQDDRWRPDKLERLLAGVEPGARLVYSDMRIVTEEGEVVSDTYWTHRRNNHTDFASLLIANTITGAASLFDRALLDDVLPFPPRQGNAYHDHWIAQVAMALGPVSYVDEPLYDYVQHGGAVVGHLRANNAGVEVTSRRRSSFRSKLVKVREEGVHLGWRAYYFSLLCRLAIASRVLELRVGDRVPADRRRTLRRLRDVARPDVPWLLWRSARGVLGADETLGREAYMLRAVAWRRMSAARGRIAARRSKPAPAPVAVPSSTGGPAEEALRPILVDYFSRDGSTLMMRLLATSPQIAVERVYPFERKYFAYLWRWSRLLDRTEWAEGEWSLETFGALARGHGETSIGPPPWLPRPLVEGSSGEGMGRAAFDLAWGEFSRRAAAATRRAHGAEGPVRYSAEKSLNTWRVALDQLPEHEVLVLLRDPRDSYASINAFGTRAGGGFGGAHQVSPERLLEHVISRQRERLRWIAQVLEEGRLPVVRYEELALDLDAVAARLADRLGVELDPAAVRSDARTHERHRTTDSPEESIGRWRRDLDPEIAARFADELGDELRAVGIEV